MNNTTITEAFTLLERDSVASAQEHFTRKEKPLDLPADGLSLVSKLASHPLFCQLTIAFLSHTSEFQVATEFRAIHDSNTFDNAEITALVFDPLNNEASPFTFLHSNEKEDVEWLGPAWESLSNCASVDHLAELLTNQESFQTKYSTIRSMIFIPADFTPLLKDDDGALANDTSRVFFQFLKYCKDHAITHFRNGKIRKSIPPFVEAIFTYFVYNIINPAVTVDLTPTDEGAKKKYFEALHYSFPTVNQNDGNENASVTQSQSSDDSEDIEEIPIPRKEQRTVDSITQPTAVLLTPQEPHTPELPDLPMEQVPIHQDNNDNSSTDSSASSDDECTVPMAKRARTPTNLTPTATRSKTHSIDLVKLASAFQSVADEDNYLTEGKYGSKSNRLNKMNSFKIQSLLNACTADCISPAIDFPQSLVNMMENKNGPDLAAYIEGSLSDHNIAVCIGFCTSFLVGNLCNRMVTSPTIQGFTNFAFGPREEESETYLLQQTINFSKNNAISDDDRKKLLNQKKYIPSDVDGLKSSIRNTTTLAKMCFGKTAQITVSLKKLKASVKDIDAFLKPYFVSHGTAFGLHFAQSVHVGISLFLSKAINGIRHMKSDFIDFEDLTFDIQMQRLRLTMRPALNPNRGSNDRGSNDKENNGVEVVNSFKQKRDNLNNDRYRKLFGNRNRSGIEPPKMEDGNPICWNFHAKGTCKSTCYRKNSHVKLSQEEIKRWNRFTAELNRRAKEGNTPNNGR